MDSVQITAISDLLEGIPNLIAHVTEGKYLDYAIIDADGPRFSHEVARKVIAKSLNSEWLVNRVCMTRVDDALSIQYIELVRVHGA